MISFYKDEAGIVMYKDDTYLETDKLVIERPATDDDTVAHPNEHTAFVALITPEPVEAAPAPVEPTPVDPAPTPEGTV